MDHASGIRRPDGCKLVINWKKDNDVTICRHDAIVKYFWRFRVSLVKFRYSSMFHVNVMTGSRVMKILFYKNWPETQKLKIQPSEFCPISGDWGKVRDTKFGTNVFHKKLLNTAKCQGYNFYCFWIIRAKQTGEGVKLRLFNFESLKKGGANLKVRRGIPTKFQKFVTVSFKLTISNYHYDI